jgi:hypothetical protein
MEIFNCCSKINNQNGLNYNSLLYIFVLSIIAGNGAFNFELNNKKPEVLLKLMCRKNIGFDLLQSEDICVAKPICILRHPSITKQKWHFIAPMQIFAVPFSNIKCVNGYQGSRVFRT